MHHICHFHLRAFDTVEDFVLAKGKSSDTRADIITSTSHTWILPQHCEPMNELRKKGICTFFTVTCDVGPDLE